MPSPHALRFSPPVPHCPHCGFDMTPLRLGRGFGIEELENIFECRHCGVMQLPEIAAASQPPSPQR